MRFVVFMLAVFIFSLLSGCDHSNHCEYSTTLLPLGAANTKSLGNDWAYFELEIGGKTRKYLYHRYYGAESTLELKE